LAAGTGGAEQSLASVARSHALPEKSYSVAEIPRPAINAGNQGRIPKAIANTSMSLDDEWNEF
jgi:hypothetical protein